MVNRILIASHGFLAKGFLSSIEIILGKQNKIDTICAYVDDVDFKEEFNKWNEKYSGEGVYIFTDLYGGSVNQYIMLNKDKNSKLISGVNLAFLLEFLVDGTNLDENIENGRLELRKSDVNTSYEDDF